MLSIPAISKDNFKTEVLDSAQPVLFDFWAEWCGTCQMFSPVVEDIAKNHADELKIVKLNVDEQPEMADVFEVRTIPMLTLIRNAKRVDSLMGARPRHMVEQWLQHHGVIAI